LEVPPPGDFRLAFRRHARHVRPVALAVAAAARGVPRLGRVVLRRPRAKETQRWRGAEATWLLGQKMVISG